MAAFWWAWNKDFDAHDFDVARSYAQSGVDYYRDKTERLSSYNSNMIAHVKEYQVIVGLNPSGTVDSATLKKMVGGSIK
ncbi:hypothetical protein BU197_24780 [Streptomyces sp. CBMA291]|nr:hypothetical protein [Streptomyces sp. CBMA291]